MGKIKLLKPLWRKAEGKTISVSEDKAEFAIRKGYAVAVKAAPSKRKKKIDPEAQDIQNK